MAEVNEVYVPAYDVSKQMEYKQIAEKIDAYLREKYEGQKVVVRPLSASEHHPEPLDDIIERMNSTGSEQDGDAKKQENEPKSAKAKYDFFGSYHEVHNASNIMEPAIRRYYEKPQEQGKPPMKVDLVLVYDAEHMEKVPYEDKDHDMHDAYKFRNPEKKYEALKGIVRVKSDSDDKDKSQAEGTPKDEAARQEGKAKPKEGQGQMSEEELIKALESAAESEARNE